MASKKCQYDSKVGETPLSNEKVWNLKRFLLLLLIGTAGAGLHFVWEHIYMFPFAQVLAPLVPLNESYWEHIKLAVTPLTVYFIIQYFISFKSSPRGTWTVAAAAGLWGAVLSMFVIHATLVAAFGEKAEFVISIITFFINVWIGMTVFHKLQYFKYARKYALWGWLTLLLLYISLIIYSYCPLHIELFKSKDFNYFGQFKG
jgi:hypothetical protein